MTLHKVVPFLWLRIEHAFYSLSVTFLYEVGENMKKPFKPCNKMGCNQLTTGSYCEIHSDEGQKKVREYNREIRNKEHVKFYNSKEWKVVRKQALVRDNFLCVKCRAEGVMTPVMNRKGVVDHIVEVSDNWDLRLTLSNLMTLCHACHNIKTAQEKKKRNK